MLEQQNLVRQHVKIMYVSACVSSVQIDGMLLLAINFISFAVTHSVRGERFHLAC